MCAIHSAFSVAVAAYTVNDLLGLMICHPFLLPETSVGKKVQISSLITNLPSCTVLFLLHWTSIATMYECCAAESRPNGMKE